MGIFYSHRYFSAGAVHGMGQVCRNPHLRSVLRGPIRVFTMQGRASGLFRPAPDSLRRPFPSGSQPGLSDGGGNFLRSAVFLFPAAENFRKQELSSVGDTSPGADRPDVGDCLLFG